MTSFRSTELYDQLLNCPDCGWSGTGSEANLIDFYGVSVSSEVHCPNCDTTIGTVQNEEGSPGQNNGERSLPID